MAKFADRMEKIAEGVTDGYQKIEDGIVEGFGKITDKFADAMLDDKGALKTGKVAEAVVGAYKKVEDAFVNTFMAKEGESVEDARARMAAQQRAREEKRKADGEKRAAQQQARIDASLERSGNAGKTHK